MWSYYGSKSKIVDCYPSPKYKTIIEPFAGSGWYSLKYSDHNVILCEKYKVVSDIWNWLISEATAPEILKYIDFTVGQDISELPIREEHKNLIGFCLNRGSVSPKRIVQKWSCQVAARPDWASTTNFALKRIAKLLPKIKHWTIINGSYSELTNQTATWFIDPPYKVGGQHYIANNIDYGNLTEFCQTRKGQVIVCENTKASWLPFKPLTSIYGQKQNTIEAIWLNENNDTLLSFAINRNKEMQT
jgi:site-specific DNA-adenine methylase